MDNHCDLSVNYFFVMATFLSEGWIENEATMRLRLPKIDLFGNHKTQVDYPQRVRERMSEREREPFMG